MIATVYMTRAVTVLALPSSIGFHTERTITAMSGRLASFRGPSTPTSSPISKQRHSSGNNTAPASPSRVSESTFHRKIRTLLLELRAVCQTWDDLVLIDGLKAAKSLVDARTDLEYVFSDLYFLRIYFNITPMHDRSNSLASLPAGEEPRYRIVGPKLLIMDKHTAELDTVISKLVSGLLRNFIFFSKVRFLEKAVPKDEHARR
jgi:hypothetical protein